MTGTTEDLEQLVRDMDDAGPGATESKTYRAIVAELERRANEEAPAENPAVGATGDEGQVHPNFQEGTDPIATVPNAQACERWDAAAAASQTDEEIDIESIIPDCIRPRWWDHNAFNGRTPASAEMRSEHRWIALKRHAGSSYNHHETILPAHAVLSIPQIVTERDPSIYLERWQHVEGRRARPDGSRYRFTLDEAEELANALQLAVAAAREGAGTVEIDRLDSGVLGEGEAR
ncbi:hypothetical protein P9990_23600 [Prescottella equi]|uniref:hypothetical protein n=1 Tax=Rhodococcus hoagii TaxID=43767 RepID=UPI0025775AD6|nr:hypothetical protein [Prescottella equi]WJJ11507.1 hypothetical protein P9990_23600 [Prescottella equi]